MGEGTGSQGVRGYEGIHQNSLFYADKGMVAFLESGWLPEAFITLVGLFERVGRKMKVRNMVGMVCRPYQATRTQSEAQQEQRMKVAGPSYQERQHAWVQCLGFGEEMSLWLLAVHLQTHQGKATGGSWNWGTTAQGGDPYNYNIALSITEGPRNCPVKVVRDGRRQGRRCGSISFTGMSKTPRLSCRRKTSPTRGAPGAK